MSETQKHIFRYLSGFTLSLVLTLLAYYVAVTKQFALAQLLTLLAVFALLQLIVQLGYFLHIFEKASRLRLVAFGFMTMILVLIVAGSIWIMYHLNYNMMDMKPTDKDNYMTSQKDKGF